MREVILTLFTVLLISCSASDDLPKDFIQPKEMQQVVWEVLQSDELVLQNRLADSSLNIKNESFRLYDQVFAVHHISRRQFYANYRYYQQHPLKYKELMEGVKKIADKERKSSQAPIH
jgi:hypothetical protein